MAIQHTHAAAQHTSRMLDSLHVEKTRVRFKPSATIFAQGDRCADVMFIEKGRVQLSVTSPGRRAAVVATLNAGSFFGEGALAGQRRRKSTAEAMTGSTITMVKTTELRRRLREDVVLSDWFRTRLLKANVRIEEDLVGQLFNGSEKRLARALLLLSHFDERQGPRHELPIISRNLLAEMSGTTRFRVDVLMNDFRKRGFLERHSATNGGTQVHRSMLSVVLQD